MSDQDQEIQESYVELKEPVEPMFDMYLRVVSERLEQIKNGNGDEDDFDNLI
jgi:hypothetical protein